MADWIVEPSPGEVVLIAKAGEGANFPDYLKDALSRFEEELPQPGQELTCSDYMSCGSFEVAK